MKLCFPAIVPRLKMEGQKKLIYDIVRKKFVNLTPEEWVRQHVVHYLIDVLQASPGLIASEQGFDLNGNKYRFDIMVYRKGELSPILLIECKAPDVALTENTTQQILRYNLVTKASLIMITNGDQMLSWEKVNENWQECNLLEAWNQHKN